jgi:hypothetical protein
MNSFPRSNADLRCIELGTLLGQLLASLFCALMFFESEALGGVLPGRLFGISPYAEGAEVQ